MNRSRGLRRHPRSGTTLRPALAIRCVIPGYFCLSQATLNGAISHEEGRGHPSQSEVSVKIKLLLRPECIADQL